ncbi:MAG: tetratricopeptide repeat protein [Burkholderiales bacterium]|jgi:predicted Zn-dependent protease|nr:tetratricopeptide repeat protein [Nitrosomonadaceae bacterium]
MNSSPLVSRFEAMLVDGKDSALLRFSLGNAHLQVSDYAKAAVHLETAVTQDPNYSAAWKLLGKAYAAMNDADRARAAFDSGIAAAERQGDKQAAKEMQVFRKRLAPPTE